jgi:hypothetical protein
MILLGLYLLAITKMIPLGTPSTPLRSTGQNGYIGGLYMCTSYGYQGQCSYARYEPSLCYNLSPPYVNNVSSFSPDQYAGDETFKFQCTLWNQKGCQGKKFALQWPGSNNMWVQGGDNMGKSVRCDFLSEDGLSTYRTWKAQRYDFDQYVVRDGECDAFCNQAL